MISDISAIRAIRSARQRYSALPWSSVSNSEQRKALSCSIPNTDQIDFDHLERLGIWEGRATETLDLLVSDQSHRRNRGPLRCRVLAKPLPPGALLRIEPELYCLSPAFTALRYAQGRELPQVLMLLMELLGTYSLPAEATHPIAWGGFWPEERLRDFAQTGLSELGAALHSPVEQAHYHCEPAMTPRQLRTVTKWATSSSAATFRTAASLAHTGSASPGESLMFGMFGLPMRYGGLACTSLPRGGMLLNHRIDFDHDAVLMSSGMPYAICDCYIPAADSDLEYNGLGHETTEARIHDGNRNNGLRGMGVRVLVINRDQMRDIVALEAIAKSLYREAGVRFRCRVDGYRKRQARLLNGLRAGIGLPPA